MHWHVRPLPEQNTKALRQDFMKLESFSKDTVNGTKRSLENEKITSSHPHPTEG